MFLVSELDTTGCFTDAYRRSSRADSGYLPSLLLWGGSRGIPSFLPTKIALPGDPLPAGHRGRADSGPATVQAGAAAHRPPVRPRAPHPGPARGACPCAPTGPLGGPRPRG